VGSRNGSGHKILIVDDELGMREGCRRSLARHGFDVRTAENGSDGLRMLQEEDYDLVLVDIIMPGISGLELLESIRQYDPSITCLVITGYAALNVATQALELGAHDVLAKPFTSEELLSMVQDALQEQERSVEEDHLWHWTAG
jgi:DNA-binding NtrC family response regulator